MYVAPLSEVKVTRGGQYGGIRKHKGLDLVAASGTPVRAVVGGQYHSSGFDPIRGYWVIWHGDDGNYWNAEHMLAPFGLRGRLNAGQTIALSGATGEVSGPHLHQGVSTVPSLTVGTFDPAPIVLTAPQPEPQPTRSSMYALVPPDPPATTGYRMVYLGCLAAGGTLITVPVTPAEWFPLIRVYTQQALQAGDNALWNAKVIALLAQVPAAGGGGGLTPAQDAKLMAIPSADADTIDEGELGQAETSGTALTLTGVQTKLDAAVSAINNHTTSKFDSLTLTTP